MTVIGLQILVASLQPCQLIVPRPSDTPAVNEAAASLTHGTIAITRPNTAAHLRLRPPLLLHAIIFQGPLVTASLCLGALFVFLLLPGEPAATAALLCLSDGEGLLRGRLALDDGTDGLERVAEVLEEDVRDVLASAVRGEVVVPARLLLHEEHVGVPRGGHVCLGMT